MNIPPVALQKEVNAVCAVFQADLITDRDFQRIIRSLSD